MTEKNIEEILTDIILDNSEGTEFEDCEIRTGVKYSVTPEELN